MRHEPIPAASVLLEGLDDQWAMVSADGTTYRELHARTHRHAPPALSPDGRRIAWWEERGRDDPEAWELHVLRLADRGDMPVGSRAHDVKGLMELRHGSATTQEGL